MNYRPITDVWILARPKVKYYGAYPAGFLGRARALLGVGPYDTVLHLCSGKVEDYPYDGFGPNDVTLDFDATLKPHIHADLTTGRIAYPEHLPMPAAVLADPPYTAEDAKHYNPSTAHPEAALPSARLCLEQGLAVIGVGDRVGILHLRSPRPPKGTKLVAAIGIWLGYEMQWRGYAVYEKR